MASFRFAADAATQFVSEEATAKEILSLQNEMTQHRWTQHLFYPALLSLELGARTLRVNDSLNDQKSLSDVAVQVGSSSTSPTSLFILMNKNEQPLGYLFFNAADKYFVYADEIADKGAATLLSFEEGRAFAQDAVDRPARRDQILEQRSRASLLELAA